MDGLALFRPFICSSWKNVWGDGRRDQRKACSKYRPLLQNPGSEGVCLKHKSTWKILADSKRDHLTRQAHCRALSPLFPSNPLYSRVCSGEMGHKAAFHARHQFSSVLSHVVSVAPPYCAISRLFKAEFAICNTFVWVSVPLQLNVYQCQICLSCLVLRNYTIWHLFWARRVLVHMPVWLIYNLYQAFNSKQSWFCI